VEDIGVILILFSYSIESKIGFWISSWEDEPRNYVFKSWYWHLLRARKSEAAPEVQLPHFARRSL